MTLTKGQYAVYMTFRGIVFCIEYVAIGYFVHYGWEMLK